MKIPPTSIAAARSAAVFSTLTAFFAFSALAEPPIYQEDDKFSHSPGLAADNGAIHVSLSADGKTALVGVSNLDFPGEFDQGAAFIFEYDATTRKWVQKAKLVASDGEGSDRLGRFVALSADGKTALVTSPTHLTGRGIAYIFERPESGWSGNVNESAMLLASDGESPDGFGTGVALDADGGVAILGSPFKDITSNDGKGVAYVFVRPAAGWSGTRNENARLLASLGIDGERLGTSVALSDSGATAIVGAPGPSAFSGTSPTAGRVYIFSRSMTGWTGDLNESAILTASDGALGDRLGEAVDVSGDGGQVVAGAPGVDGNFFDDVGSAYVFVRPKTGWNTRNQTAELDADDSSGPERGESVAINSSGTVVLVGSPERDRVHLYNRSGKTWANKDEEDAIFEASDSANDDFGRSIDIDASGEKIIIGNRGASVGGVAKGATYYFVGTYQPDNWIGTRRSRQKGNNRYNRSGAGQTVKAVSERGRKVKLFFTVQNDGELPDTFSVRGTRKNKGFKIKYLQLSPIRRNITGPMTRSGLVLPGLAPGARAGFKLEVDPKKGVRKTKVLKIRSTSQANPRKVDTVKGKVKATR